MTKPKGSGRLIRRKAGGQIKHGAYSIVLRKELLEQFPEIGRYCRDTYEGLLRDLSPDGSELPMAKRVLLDRLMSQLTTVSMIDTYIGRAGVLRADKSGVLAAHPILEQFLSLNNQIRNTLQALGLERAKLEALVLTPEELMVEVVKDEEEPRRKAVEASPDEGDSPQPAPEPGGKCVRAHSCGAIERECVCGAGCPGEDAEGGGK